VARPLLSDPFVPRELRWTPEHVRRFWSYFAHSAHAEQAYFSSHTGDSLIAFVQRHVPLSSEMRVLDWGCGPGFLVERLMQRGIRAEGLEFSKESVDRARARCERYPGFAGITLAEGIPCPVGDSSVDVVLLVEVLEHLLPEQIAPTLEDIRRILRPGGVLVVTTPHDENIESAKTICPECGLIFHPWQHVGAFTAPRLAHLLDQHGLGTVVCKAMTLGGWGPGRALRVLLKMLRPDVAGGEPHLVCIGRKRA